MIHTCGASNFPAAQQLQTPAVMTLVSTQAEWTKLDGFRWKNILRFHEIWETNEKQRMDFIGFQRE